MLDANSKKEAQRNMEMNSTVNRNELSLLFNYIIIIVVFFLQC